MLIDATVIRAPPCAAGAAGRPAAGAALGRARGGLRATKRPPTGGLATPSATASTGGPPSYRGQPDLFLPLPPAGAAAGVGDQGYDRDALIQAIAARVRVAVIPARRHRTQPRASDGFMDKEPRLIVCFGNKIKPDRRICSRFEQLARNDMGFLRFASALIWLR